MPVSRKLTCKRCGGEGHIAFNCFLAPKKPLRKESPKSRTKRLQTAEQWYEQNPPNEHGLWKCYLQINPDCRRWVDRTTVNLEHVKSRARHPELKYDVENIKPACPACNELKGSRDAEEVQNAT